MNFGKGVRIKSEDEYRIATVPKSKSLRVIKKNAEDCRACPLWKNAMQTVFGEGPRVAKIMLIGEQPGNQEDIQGRPFVGPAGRLLAHALDEAKIDRNQVYVTNAVKHLSGNLKANEEFIKNQMLAK